MGQKESKSNKKGKEKKDVVEVEKPEKIPVKMEESGSGKKKKSRKKDAKEAKRKRKQKVDPKVAQQVEELERDGVGEGELVFNSTPGQKVARDDFELMTLIGKGSFGKVMQVRKRDTGQILAMKVLRKDAIIARKQVTHTRAEKSILAKIQHPFIVKLHYAFQTKEKLYMILDYVNGGELFFHLKREGRFTEERVKFYAAEIISAIAHLHSLDIVYRDLKPENILLDRQGHVIITDFGLSKEIDEDEGTHTFCVPAEHEILTERGFMDLPAYEAAVAHGAQLRVASFDKVAQALVFELPHRHVVYAAESRTLVELTAADDAVDTWGPHSGDFGVTSKNGTLGTSNVSIMVTRDHDLFAQLDDDNKTRFAKIKARTLVDSTSHNAVRQMACAVNGVAVDSTAECAALAGVRKGLHLDTDEKLAGFLELYGFWLVAGATDRAADGTLCLRFAQDVWVRACLALLGAPVVADAEQLCIRDAAWVAVFGATASLADWVWSLGAKKLRMVVTGLRRPSTGVIETSSVGLRDEIVRVLLMAGLSAHFHAMEGGKATMWRISCAEAASAAGSPVVTKARGEIRRVAYEGRVWCFTMPSGFVWVRRAHKDAKGVVTKASRAVLTGNCGTPEYLAPEVLKGQGHGMGVDWWSLGTLLYEMMTGLPPFFSQNINIMYQKILNGELKFPSHMSPEAQSLLTGFLTRDPDQRLGSRATGGEDKIKDHPWFAGLDWDLLDQRKVDAPWIPPVADELDVGQIDETFTREEVDDSEESDGMEAAPGAFENFTFVDEEGGMAGAMSRE